MISRKSSTIRSHQFGAGGFTHCIHTQEALIEKVKQDISGQFNAINIKIKNHSHQKKHRNVSKERIEWKIQYQKLRKDENRIFNDINLTLSSQRDHLPYFECSLEENKDMTWCARKQISMMLQEKFEQSLSLESMKEEMMQVENDLDKELKEVKDDANECSAEIKRKYDSEEGDYSKSSVLVPAANNNFLDFDLLGELKHILETFILSGFSSILAEDINLLSDKFLVEEQQPDSLHEVMLDKMPFSASCRTSSTNLNKFNHQEGWKPFSSSSVYVLKRQHDLKHEEQKHPLNKEIAAGDECSSKVDEELCKKPSIKKSSKETKEQSFCIISKQVKGNSNAILQQKAQMSVLAIDHLLNKINKWINSEIRNEVHDRLEWLHKIHRITEERYVGHKIRCKVIEKDTKQMNTVKREQQMKSIKQKLDRYLTEKMEVMLQLRRKDEISNCLDTSTRIAQIANNSERYVLMTPRTLIMFTATNHPLNTNNVQSQAPAKPST
jgi:hypothetical protein